jgi:hypothetical protein
MFELLQTVLKNNNLNLEMCIGNATDGAANMQGIYIGFTAWLVKSSSGQVHVCTMSVCCLHILVKYSYNIYSSAYSNLGLAYKYLLTLPSTQVHIYFINYLNTL